MLSVFLLVLRGMCLCLESFLRQLESFHGEFAVTLQSLHLATLEGQLMHSNVAGSSIYRASCSASMTAT